MKNTIATIAALVTIAAYVSFAGALLSDLQTVKPSVLKIVSAR